MNLPYISSPNEIPNSEYHNSEKYKEFISSSVLKQLQISPKWLKYCQLHPEDSRIKLEYELKGSVYHDMICSIANKGDLSEFEKKWIVFDPPINQNTGNPYGYDTQKFMNAYTEFQKANPGKTICSQTEIDLANNMIQELLTGNEHLSKDINYLLKYGKAEISHFCEYQGGLFKFRTDLKTNTKIIDWKTTAHLFPKKENWNRQIIQCGYHISAAFYQFFDYVISGRWKKFYWVCQEKEPPYDFNIIDASNWTWDISNDNGEQIVEANLGAQILIKLLEQYLICKEKDCYPGYSIFTQPDWKKHRIAISEIPGYAKQIINFYN